MCLSPACGAFASFDSWPVTFLAGVLVFGEVGWWFVSEIGLSAALALEFRFEVICLANDVNEQRRENGILVSLALLDQER